MIEAGTGPGAAKPPGIRHCGEAAAGRIGRSGSGKDEDMWLDASHTALKKLGLRLDPRKVPVEMAIVDHLEKAPTEN